MSDNNETASKLLAILQGHDKREVSNTSEQGGNEDLLKSLILKRLHASDNLSNRDKADLLERRYTSFTEENSFKEGMLVSWKPGLRNKETVSYKEPAIILECLETPIFDKEKGAGSTYFMEPLDLVLAFLDEDNDFITFYSDSRRFEPYKP